MVARTPQQGAWPRKAVPNHVHERKITQIKQTDPSVWAMTTLPCFSAGVSANVDLPKNNAGVFTPSVKRQSNCSLFRCNQPLHSPLPFLSVPAFLLKTSWAKLKIDTTLNPQPSPARIPNHNLFHIPCDSYEGWENRSSRTCKMTAMSASCPLTVGRRHNARWQRITTELLKWGERRNKGHSEKSICWDFNIYTVALDALVPSFEMNWMRWDFKGTRTKKDFLKSEYEAEWIARKAPPPSRFPYFA